jgi:hypothetical protein
MQLGRFFRVELEATRMAVVLGTGLWVGQKGMRREAFLKRQVRENFDCIRKVMGERGTLRQYLSVCGKGAVLTGQSLVIRQHVLLLSVPLSHVLPQRKLEPERLRAEVADVERDTPDDDGDVSAHGNHDLAVSIAAQVGQHGGVVGAEKTAKRTPGRTALDQFVMRFYKIS